MRDLYVKWLSLFALLVPVVCAAAEPLPDPCSLLTISDVEQAQGNIYLQATKSVKTSGGVTVSQCYFRLAEETRSVTLELTRAASPHATHELWEKQFEAKPQSKEKGEEAENEAHGVEVKGIGEDAIWSGNRVSGALYVLTKDAILRVSLGGIGTQELKVERAKMLARRVLPKLNQ